MIATTPDTFLFLTMISSSRIHFADNLVRKSGLLDNDNIVVSRKANSYVLTAVLQTKENNKRTYNSAKKLNGAEAMLKNAGVGKSMYLDLTAYSSLHATFSNSSN